jgi:hypothetical protein
MTAIGLVRTLAEMASEEGTVAPAPPGYVSHSEYIGLQLVACAAITAVLSTLFLGLRMYTRKFLVRNFGWDDWWILLAWVTIELSSFPPVFL